MADGERTKGKKKIAILGAGPAGLAAAFGLTATAALRESNEVTVYQVGWRAGGKCATGRRQPGDHIEQNCAHYLFGCYDNTFAVIRAAYDELHAAGEPNLPDFDDILLPRSLVVMKEQFKGEWTTWLMEFPANTARPGAEGGEFLDPLQYAGMTLEWMLEGVFGWKFTNRINKLEYADHQHELPRLFEAPLGMFERVVHGVASGLGRFVLGAARRLHHERAWLDRVVVWLLKRLRAFVWWVDRSKVEDDLERRRKWALLDYGTTTVIGLLTDQVLKPGGFERIDHLDFKQWLKQHGATKYGYDSPFVTLWYQNALAYRDGDVKKESLSAAIGLLAQMRAVYTYKGAVAFSLENEIGDSFIAPLYLALRRRGVKFRFFHRVRDVVTDAGHKTVTGLVVERQVSMASGDPDSYDPLVDVKGRPCWPDAPQRDQWEAADQQRFDELREAHPDWDLDLGSFYTRWRGEDLNLERGRDFDDVVFAMPHSVIKYYARGLYDNLPRWQKLFDENPISESQSLRLWFRPGLGELGWPYPQPILSGYQTPYCTWEDDGQLVALETWPEKDIPQAIACVFGPLEVPATFPPGPDDSAYLPAQRARVDEEAGHFETHLAAGLWPDCGTPDNPHGIDPDKLIWKSRRANSGPLEGYFMTWPGALSSRMQADDSGVEGLYLAGDWVRNGLEAGSMEGATMGGLQASRAICGWPEQIIGERGSFG